jgi:hypothetical protein
MNIIFHRAAAEELAKRYLVLDLETVDINGTPTECFCVVPGDSLGLADMPLLEHHRRLHQQMTKELAAKNYAYCTEAIGHLMGKFGGELDTFYQVVLDRIPV